MNSWTIFLIGGVVLTLVIAGRLLLPRRKHILGLNNRSVAEDTFLLMVLIWLASLSVLAYIAFTFGKR